VSSPSVDVVVIAPVKAVIALVSMKSTEAELAAPGFNTNAPVTAASNKIEESSVADSLIEH
jgi:hypothetical protein